MILVVALVPSLIVAIAGVVFPLFACIRGHQLTRVSSGYVLQIGSRNGGMVVPGTIRRAGSLATSSDRSRALGI